MRLKRMISAFFVLGLIFFVIGWATGRDVYFYIAIPFLAISFFAGGGRTRR